MKLSNYAMQDALASGDWASAAFCLVTHFELPEDVVRSVLDKVASEPTYLVIRRTRGHHAILLLHERKRYFWIQGWGFRIDKLVLAQGTGLYVDVPEAWT